MPRTAAPASLADQVVSRSEEPLEAPEQGDDELPDYIDPATLIPTGSTLLNLAMSDHVEGGYQMGRMDLLIGDSDSGKTMLALTGFAEAANQTRFDDYRLILDSVETNSGIDLARMFGKTLADRIEPPRLDEDEEPLHSDTIQDFQDNLFYALDDGRPFLYVLDSWDALTSEEELDKLDVQRKAREKGKDAAGHMGTEKAKAGGQILRTIKARLKRTDSHLLIIFQVRDNIGAMPGQSSKVRSGGRAPKFYSQHETWLTAVGQHKDDKTKRRLGVKSEAKVEKNHLTGKKREAQFSIFYDYGVDDIGSLVDFLAEQGVLKKAGAYLDPRGLWGLEAKMFRNDLIRAIEDQGLERRLRREAGKAWAELEDSIKLNRKPRF